MPNPVGQIIYENRVARNLSLAALAEISGVDAATIWRVEQGKTDPRFDTQLLPLLNAMGLSCQFLIPTFNRKKGTT